MREDRPVAKGDPDQLTVPAERENRDPITGARGAHPVGVGVGATAGGVATGAAVGSVAGPVGTMIGAAVGAIAGGLIGKGAAEMVDPTVEEAYWREEYATRPYARPDTSYADYAPAYRYGAESYNRHWRRGWSEAEADLARDWEGSRGDSRLAWDDARDAVRDAWDRAEDKLDRNLPG
jgi:hypothetical protein